MKITTLAIAAAMTALLIGGAAFAQTAAPPPAAPAAPAVAAHSAKSIECSKEADAKGLHGEARRKFRADCKRGK
jgi:psiF repeat-containing protein